MVVWTKYRYQNHTTNAFFFSVSKLVFIYFENTVVQSYTQEPKWKKEKKRDSIIKQYNNNGAYAEFNKQYKPGWMWQ